MENSDSLWRHLKKRKAVSRRRFVLVERGPAALAVKSVHIFLTVKMEIF